MKMASVLTFNGNGDNPVILQHVLASVRQNLLANAEQLIRLLSM